MQESRGSNHIRYKNYVIIEFKDGIQTVPVKWLVQDNKSCHYPVHIKSTTTANQFVKNMVPVDKKWPLFEIIKILGSSNDYNRVKEKEMDVIKYNLSEVDTEVESIVKSQRKERAKKKLFSDEEENVNSLFAKKSSTEILLLVL